MTRSDVDRINAERLASWATILGESHCTAALLVGVGHDAVCGEIHLCVPENADDLLTVAFLEEAARMVRRKRYRRV